MTILLTLKGAFFTMEPTTTKRTVLKFTSEKKLAAFEEEARPKQDEEKAGSKFLAMISLASELGFAIALPIAGGAIIGQFLDNRFHTGPRITLSLLFFGLFIGAANIYFIVKESERA
jgi:F0F1-type ATP synthase assembly protein I